MSNKLNQEIEYDRDLAKELQNKLPFPILAIDTETTGNYPYHHGLIELAGVNIHEPSINFIGNCHLQDKRVISLKDIKKNTFGDKNNLTRIINPNGDYSELRDVDNPFIEPNYRWDRNNQYYLRLERLAKSALNGHSGKDFIEQSINEMMREFFQWMKNPDRSDDDKNHPIYILDGGSPVFTALGHNVSFDVAFVNDGFKSANIGSISDREIHWPEDASKPTHFKFFTPYSFAYRGNMDIAMVATDYLLNQCIPEDVIDYWSEDSDFTGQNTVIPYLRGQNGLTLDKLCKLSGLNERTTSHDALDDTLRTVEAGVRILTGRPYLEMYAHMPVGELVSLDYRKDALKIKAEK